MKPLSTIAVGLLVALVYDRLHGYDLLADPVGWLIVLLGVRALPAAVPRPGLYGAGGLALVVSVPLWLPAVQDRLDDADPSLPWALSLPALVFAGWLARQLSEAAAAAGDRTAHQVLRGLVTLAVVVAVLPVLVFGGGVDALHTPASVLSNLRALLMVVVLLVYAGRPWAVPSTSEPAESPADPGGTA